MSSRFKGKLCLHLRAKELTIFRDSLIWQLAAWALGVGWGSGPLGAATRCRAPSSAVSFFFRDLAFFGDSEDSGFGDTDGRTTTDDETGLTPDPIPRTENRQNFIAKFFLAILNENGGHPVEKKPKDPKSGS